MHEKTDKLGYGQWYNTYFILMKKNVNTQVRFNFEGLV